jgi:hypothetical protein
MQSFLWAFGTALVLSLTTEVHSKETNVESNPFVKKEFAGQKIRYATFVPQQWHKGPPFLPYDLLANQEETPPDNYCLAEYDHEGQLISLTSFAKGGQEKWKQTIKYKNSAKNQVMIKQSNGDISTFFEYTNQGSYSIRTEWIDLAVSELSKIMPDSAKKLKQYKVTVTELGSNIVVIFDNPIRDPSRLGGSGTDLLTFEVTLDPINKKVVKAHFSR